MPRSRAAVDRSFNTLIVDGCTSTNDTVIVLASGAAGAVDAADLTAALTDACAELAWQIAADAEGATAVAEIRVVGGADDADARLAARAVADSLLVKFSLFGDDPYWGRVFSELGASGAAFDPDRVRVAYGAGDRRRDRRRRRRRRGRGRGAPGRRPRRRSPATSASARARPGSSRPISATATSTRTGRRRERRARPRRGADRGDPRRGDAVHPALPGKVVVVKYGGTRSVDADRRAGDASSPGSPRTSF